MSSQAVRTLRHFVPILPVLAADSTTDGISDVELATRHT